MTKGARVSTVTPLAAALEVDHANTLDWNDSADLVVVGWGAAGACAAIEARSAGASVLVIARFDGGGTSALSGGVVYAGGGTPYQRQAGFDDSPEAMADYLRHVDEANGQVMDTAGQRIGGLFAAGRTAIGLPSSRYVSGLSLADCVFSLVAIVSGACKAVARGSYR